MYVYVFIRVHSLVEFDFRCYVLEWKLVASWCSSDCRRINSIGSKQGSKQVQSKSYHGQITVQTRGCRCVRVRVSVCVCACVSAHTGVCVCVCVCVCNTWGATAAAGTPAGRATATLAAPAPATAATGRAAPATGLACMYVYAVRMSYILEIYHSI